MKNIKILSIETSCDETSCAILQVKNKNLNLLSHTIYSQIKDHIKHGGVVPEFAARLHVPKIIPVIEHTLSKANILPKDISAIAVTTGPGLITSLLVGINTACVLSYVWQKPLISVNHMEGHIVSSLLSNGLDAIQSPAICLTVSGGHTELVLVKNFGDYTIIGKTRDDAVGECFDKVAKMLGLTYPGGPKISILATQSKNKIEFTPPMLNSDDLDFSFSGLKTAVLYKIKELGGLTQLSEQQKADIANGFENSAIQVLIHKTQKAITKFKAKTLLIGGGVCANTKLRTNIQNLLNTNTNLKILIPELEFCGDNAGMIALAGYFKFIKNEFADIKNFRPDPNWSVGTKHEYI